MASEPQEVTASPLVKLNNGLTIPQLGLGTFLSDKGLVGEAVKQAIKMGYRHIDCAWVYMNEEEVGSGIDWAINEGICKREDLFITTKLSGSHYNEIKWALNDSLKKLRLDYVDLYLIHLPFEMKNDPTIKSLADLKKEHCIGYNAEKMSKVWSELEQLVSEGLIRSIGVSNFTIKKLEAILKTAKLIPVVNQVEIQAYFQQNKLRSYCKSKGILIQAFNTLGNPGLFKGKLDVEPLLDNAEVKQVCEKHRATPAQVCIAFGLAIGDILIPKSVTESRLRENFKSINLKLDEDDVKRLKSLDKNLRLYTMKAFCDPAGIPYEEFFDVEFDSSYQI
ncbi:Alcohol dehydrogenase -like [Oopsacas minuta]|uniref:Alcohol dehydrogenase -like n=1 Tax=Oopsacas minuta TaxID=111878 RepID=A0AAV7JET9_9METZ|nr:Alcohol dehydrogenase -like [Oopsacas minuta]